MALTLADLYASPDHYLHSFADGAAVFLRMDRAAYHRSIFLDGRVAAAANGAMRIPVAALTGAVPPPRPTGWIFHVAHCGSTLLARALDDLASNLVLREPLALRQLAFGNDPRLLAATVAMLSKRYDPALPTIVKANVPVNFILPDLIALDPAVRAIFLHLPLRDYLLAILRSDTHRDWLRRVTAQLSAHLDIADDAPDAERAAALWLAQMRAFAAAIARLPDARSLDAEAFFAEPLRVLAAAAVHLQVSLSPQAIDGIVVGPLFATYSKNPDLAFDNAERLARRAAAEAAIADELALAAYWIGARAGQADAASAALAAVDLTA